MTTLKVTTAELRIRTVDLTRPLMKQFRILASVPVGMLDQDGHVKLENGVGWIHGRGFPWLSEHATYLILTNNNGDYFLYSYLNNKAKRDFKQVYIV